MRNILPTLAILSLFALSACNNVDEGNVEIVFKATYGNSPLTTFTDYEYAFDQNIRFTTADMYVCNVDLRTEGGFAELIDVELVDMSFAEQAAAEEGYSILVKNVIARTYQRLDFIIGLDADKNSGRPEDYPSDDPLAEPRYWEPWTSYIFAKTEGNLDTAGSGDFDLGFLFHTGTDPLARAFQVPENFNVVDGKTTRITITLDYRKLFGVNDIPIDIASNPINHNPEDTEQILKMVDNYINALTVQVEQL